MTEQMFQNVLPFVWYTVAVLTCLYIVMDTFFFALYLKRKESETSDVAVDTPIVHMHNNSVQKWLRPYFSQPINDNNLNHRAHIDWIGDQPDPDNVA